MISKDLARKWSSVKMADQQKKLIRIAKMPMIEICIIKGSPTLERMQISETNLFQIVPVRIVADLMTKLGDRMTGVTVDLNDVIMFDGIDWK